jgi:hypothetical protein
MAVSITFNLSKSADCTSISIDDFFTSNPANRYPSIESPYTIIPNGVTIQISKNCGTQLTCSCCPDAPFWKVYTIPSTGSLPTGLTWDTSSLVIPVDEVGIYNVTIKIEYREDVDDPIFTYYKSNCVYVDCSEICKIICAITENPYDNDLVNIHTAISQAIECGNCCKACELREYLLKLLKKVNCKIC